MQRLLELADNNRKDEELQNKDGDGAGKEKVEEEKVDEEEKDASAKYGYLGWLHKIVDLSQPSNQDIHLDKIVEVDQLHEGLIVDFMDEYGQWHLAITCKIQKDNE